MVLGWLSPIWKSKRSDPNLFKFTDQFTHQLNVQSINTFFANLSKFSHANEALRRINEQKQMNLDYIDSEIKTLQNIQPPAFQKYTIHRRMRSFSYDEVIPHLFEHYKTQVKEYDIYKQKISDSLSFLTTKKDFITSKRFSL